MMRKGPTPRTKRILALAATSDKPLRVIAAKFGISAAGVSILCTKYGVTYTGQRRGRKRLAKA